MREARTALSLEDRLIAVSQGIQAMAKERDTLAEAVTSLESRLATAEADRDEDDRAADLSNCLNVLCRVFDDGADAGWQAFLAWYNPSQWLSPHRALGAYIGQRYRAELAAALAERDRLLTTVRHAAYLLSTQAEGAEVRHSVVPAYAILFDALYPDAATP